MSKGFKDNTNQLAAKLHKDLNIPRTNLNIPRTKLGRAVVRGATFLVTMGYEEGIPIHNTYKELFCPWCGRAHTSSDCLALLKKFNEEQKEV